MMTNNGITMENNELARKLIEVLMYDNMSTDDKVKLLASILDYKENVTKDYTISDIRILLQEKLSIESKIAPKPVVKIDSNGKEITKEKINHIYGIFYEDNTFVIAISKEKTELNYVGIYNPYIITTSHLKDYFANIPLTVAEKKPTCKNRSNKITTIEGKTAYSIPLADLVRFTETVEPDNYISLIYLKAIEETINEYLRANPLFTQNALKNNSK